jgi:hypothetical protein
LSLDALDYVADALRFGLTSRLFLGSLVASMMALLTSEQEAGRPVEEEPERDREVVALP